MSAQAVLDEVHAAGVSLEAEGGELWAVGAQDAVDQIAPLAPRIREHKAELLKLLAEASDSEVASHCLIIQPAGAQEERFFSPPASRAEEAEALANVLADPAAALPSIRALLARHALPEPKVAATAPVPRSCATGAHLRRPGTAEGCAAGRADLPPLFGAHHPLRQLPADGGEHCVQWAGPGIGARDHPAGKQERCIDAATWLAMGKATGVGEGNAP
jgi:hypothetical protein